MAKLSLNTIGSRYGSIDALNDNFDAIEAAIENTLSLDGTSPNEMEADLDLNGHDLLNVGEVNTASLRLNGVAVSPSTTTYNGVVKETQTATSGQTVFNLSTISYSPLTNNMSVYVDGVYQNPSRYTETSSTRVTFSEGLHVGAVVDFQVMSLNELSGTADSANVTHTPAPTSILGITPRTVKSALDDVTHEENGSSKVGFIASGTGAEARSVENKLRDVVSVKDFGAVGDGVTDDTTAIQTALDNVPAGSTLLFPNGTYLVDVNNQSAPITDGTDISKCALLAAVSVQLVGDFGAVIKAKEGASPATNNYIIACTASVKFSNLEFNGDRLNITSSYGIQLNASESTVQNCVFKDFDGSPVVVQGASAAALISDIGICDNRFENNGNTVFFAWIERFKLNGNTCYNISEGFDLDKYCRNGQINNNSFDTTRGGGADAAIECNGGDNITISGNSIRNQVKGILLSGKTVSAVDYYTKGITVTGNSIIGCSSYGIVTGGTLGGTQSTQNTVIVGNTISDGAIEAVNLRGVSVSFIGNTVTGNRGALLLDGVNSKNISVSNNLISGNSRYGVQIDSATQSNISITGNVIADNNSDTGYNGIQMSDVTSATISNNTITGAHDHGIRVQGTGTVNLSGNTVTGATTGSVRIASTTTWTVNGQNSAKIYPQTNDVFYNGASVYYSDTDPGTLSSSYVFREGDIVWKLTQTAGTSPGWVCVTAGSPGTWKAMANLAA